jgi:hypothetical protein
VRNVVAVGIFGTDPLGHALEFRFTELVPDSNEFIYVDSCWAAQTASDSVPMVRYSASTLRDALRAVQRSDASTSAAPIVIEGGRRGVRVTGGDEEWSTRADVVGSRLLDEGQQIELSAPSTLAFLTIASGRGANVDLALREECLEVSSEQTAYGHRSTSAARATLSAPPPRRDRVSSWPDEPVVATITVGGGHLLDALLDLRGLIGDGGVRLRTDTHGLSLLVPGSSDLSRHLAATVDGGVVDVTIRRLHLALAVSTVEPGASPDSRVTLDVHEGGAVVVRSATDPRIVHRLSSVREPEPPS